MKLLFYYNCTSDIGSRLECRITKGSWSEIRWRKIMVSYRDPVMREFMDTGSSSTCGQMMEYTQKGCAQCRWSFFQTSMQHIRKINNTTDIPQNKPTWLQIEPTKKLVSSIWVEGGRRGEGGTFSLLFNRNMWKRLSHMQKSLNFNTGEDN